MTLDEQRETIRARYGRNPLTRWIGRNELAAMRNLTAPGA